MDIFTHITAGAIGAQAIRRPRRDRYLLLFCILAATLPDIDNFIGFWGQKFYMIHHRGLTHSFIGGILLVAIFVGIFKLFVKPFPFKRGLLLAYLFIALHIFLDLITSYGTQIFSPLSRTRNREFGITLPFLIYFYSYYSPFFSRSRYSLTFLHTLSKCCSRSGLLPRNLLTTLSAQST